MNKFFYALVLIPTIAIAQNADIRIVTKELPRQGQQPTQKQKIQRIAVPKNDQGQGRGGRGGRAGPPMRPMSPMMPYFDRRWDGYRWNEMCGGRDRVVIVRVPEENRRNRLPNGGNITKAQMQNLNPAQRKMIDSIRNKARQDVQAIIKMNQDGL